MKLLENNISNYLIIVLLIIFICYYVNKCISYQSYIIEGLANNKRDLKPKDYYSDLDRELKNLNDEKNDIILPKKYKKEYENMLIELYKTTQLDTILNLTNYSNLLIQKKDTSVDLEKINKLYNVNNSINSSLKYLNSL